MKLVATMSVDGELNKVDPAVQRLRDEIGMKPGQLLSNGGESADILAVDEAAGTVTLGVLTRRYPIVIKRSMIVKERPQ